MRTTSAAILITFNENDSATILVNGQEMEIDLTAPDGRNPIRRLRS